MSKRQVIWLNGAFGVGKTTVARKLASLLPDAMTLDPEDIGGMLRKVIPVVRQTGDFQDLRIWRRLTAGSDPCVPPPRPWAAALSASARACDQAPLVYQRTVECTESVCSGAAFAGSRRAATSSTRRSVADGSPAWKA